MLNLSYSSLPFWRSLIPINFFHYSSDSDRVIRRDLLDNPAKNAIKIERIYLNRDGI